jgi:predicted ester cyclase
MYQVVRSRMAIYDPPINSARMKETSMSIEQNKTVVRRLYEEANDQARFDLLDELTTDDMALHTPAPIDAPGREGLRQLLGFFYTAFPVQHTEIHALIAEGDLVVAHHTHYATNDGSFMGKPPTGREVVVQGIEIFRLADGRIAELWHHDDMLSLFQQLGIVALPGQG